MHDSVIGDEFYAYDPLNRLTSVFDAEHNALLVNVYDDMGEIRFKLGAGEYVRWRSSHFHGTCNPQKDWSISMHIAFRSINFTEEARGTPVRYAYSRTMLSSYSEQLEQMYRARKGNI